MDFVVLRIDSLAWPFLSLLKVRHCLESSADAVFQPAPDLSSWGLRPNAHRETRQFMSARIQSFVSAPRNVSRVGSLNHGRSVSFSCISCLEMDLTDQDSGRWEGSSKRLQSGSIACSGTSQFACRPLFPSEMWCCGTFQTFGRVADPHFWQLACGEHP